MLTWIAAFHAGTDESQHLSGGECPVKARCVLQNPDYACYMRGDELERGVARGMNCVAWKRGFALHRK
jgi:hypothetical protein